jgi:hypothetical protein
MKKLILIPLFIIAIGCTKSQTKERLSNGDRYMIITPHATYESVSNVYEYTTNKVYFLDIKTGNEVTVAGNFTLIKLKP